MNRWLVVSSCDERYDFNLEMKIFKGTLEEFEDSFDASFFDENHRSLMKNGVYVYHRKDVEDNYCSNVGDEDWDVLKNYLEVVKFFTTILIPFENLEKDDFFFVNEIVNRNVKYGFLDIKSK